MKRQSAIELVTMCDNLDKMDEVLELLVGSSFSLGFNDGLLGAMTYIHSIIRRECNQSLINNEIDLEENEYYKILESNMSVEDKVDALFNNLS